MGGLSFATPWLLASLALLPMLWWLLKVVPPSPRRQIFPAIALLIGLEAVNRAAARTPWWLLLLRLALAAAIILAAAHPLMNAAAPVGEGPLLLVLDDGWASAPAWSKLHQRAESLLDGAERAGQPVRLLFTAPAADNSPPRLQGPMPAAQAQDCWTERRPIPGRPSGPSPPNPWPRLPRACMPSG